MTIDAEELAVAEAKLQRAREARQRLDREAVAAAVNRTTSTQWPDWVCKNNCGHAVSYPADTKFTRCPSCKSVLIRWKLYEEKR